MEFKYQKPKNLVETFVNYSVKKVLHFSAAVSADAFHSRFDSPRSVMEYPFAADLEVISPGAWNSLSIVISALKEKINYQKTSMNE